MPRKKREEYEEDSFLDEEIADEEDENQEEERQKDELSDNEDVDGAEESDEADQQGEKTADEEEPIEEVEEEIDYPPDDEKAVAALKKLRVRLDISEKGNVWRAIFDDSNGKDPALLLLNGLPALKELWLLGTKVSPEAAAQFKEDNPRITVYY